MSSQDPPDYFIVEMAAFENMRSAIIRELKSAGHLDAPFLFNTALVSWCRECGSRRWNGFEVTRMLAPAEETIPGTGYVRQTSCHCGSKSFLVEWNHAPTYGLFRAAEFPKENHGVRIAMERAATTKAQRELDEKNNYQVLVFLSALFGGGSVVALIKSFPYAAGVLIFLGLLCLLVALKQHRLLFVAAAIMFSMAIWFLFGTSGPIRIALSFFALIGGVVFLAFGHCIRLDNRPESSSS